MSTPAADKIERCSAQMLLRFPWWASLYLHLVRIETEAVDTMATDGTHLFYNPHFTESLTDKECIGVLLHETGHCAFLHVYRRKYREPQRWNVACDKAVNAVLVAANVTLPKGGVPPGPLGSLAEELYEQIADEEMALYTKDILEVGSMGDVKGADGKPLTEKDWRDALAGAHGLVPDYVARIVEEATAPAKNWKDELARFVHSHRKSDTRTWKRPSRRVPGLPGWNQDAETNIVICIDTSGSVTGPVMGAFVAECRAILEISGVTAVVISADAEVSQVLQPGDPLPVTLIGGGGTNFAPALKEAENYEPNGIIYLTDGDGEYPPGCPYDVLWALTKPKKVPFGDKTVLEGNFDGNPAS
jgi:predicted metal-dependent peptidase